MEANVYCPRCECERPHVREMRSESYSVRGDNVVMDVPLLVCTVCGESTVETDFGDPVEKAYEIYRKNHGLLSGRDIQRIRERWKLSQDSLARLLGMSQATINRYEQGALQNQKEDELIRACEDSNRMQDLISRRGNDVLNERQRNAVLSCLDVSHSSANSGEWLSSFEELMPHEVSVRSGFRQFDFDRYAAVVVWFSQSVQALTQTKLYKLLFYSDYLAFRYSSQSLTGAVYRAMPYGPVPMGFNGLRAKLEMEDYVLVNEVTYQNGNTGEEFRPGSRADEFIRILTSEDLRVLQFVRDNLGGLTPTQISDRSHREVAWSDTPRKHVISYMKAKELSLRLQDD